MIVIYLNMLQDINWLLVGKCKWAKHFNVQGIFNFFAISFCHPLFFFSRKSNPSKYTEKPVLTATKVKRKSSMKENMSNYHKL